MRERIIFYLDNAVAFLLFAVAGLTPLLFVNLTTDFFEIPKLIFLIVTTIVLLGLWIFSWILKGKISISRTPLDVALLALLVSVVLSTLFSLTKSAAIYGNLPRVHGTVVSWVVYIALYFVTVSQLRNVKNIRYLLYTLYGSAAVVGLITFLSFFNVFLPFDFAKAVNFTPTGSTFSTIAMLLLLLPLPIMSLVSNKRYFPVPAAASLATFFAVVLVLIGSLPSYLLLALVFAGCVVVANRNQLRKNLVLFLIPFGAAVLAFLLAYLPFPGPLGALHTLENNYPKEIQLPLSVSWKVSATAFRDTPFFGTGPGSYLFNFTAYKPVEFNALPVWSFSFDTAYNEFLQVLGTLGILGSASFILFCLVILTAARRNLMTHSYEGLEAEEDPILLPALAISALVAVLLLAIHATTLVSLVMTLFVLAAFMMAQRPIREKVMELSMGIRATTSENRQLDLFPIIVFIVFVIAIVPVLYGTFTAVTADYYHRQALSQSVKNGTLTYQYLQKAESLNPQVDLYRVDMAQTNFALANAIATQKGQKYYDA